MGNVHPGAPLWLLDALKQTGRYRIFVETGTAQGDTALAAGDRFDTVITMEADPRIAADAHERLSGRKGILPLTGDSRELLPKLMPRLAGPAVFWLAAASRPGADDGDGGPLAAELAAVGASPLPHLVVMPREAGLPDRDALLAALGAGSARDVALVEDRLIAVPRAEAAVWSILIPDGRPEFLLPGHG
ncbi:MAG: hypothetical protein B193_0840 [Solidesulfovibrio magneticus str. Maddingley MBC34]|uniref:Uncharacterized protein n=1 Tax=Solidesulfovibrio magneticus str. Maddingley MBC34 TaxID=1206767 RepID=K6HD93_9BACT|nr:MAG: hypothetical protein B193_0840 [Solidesulfovibrio magneticus str. Maddingley MBC34]